MVIFKFQVNNSLVITSSCSQKYEMELVIELLFYKTCKTRLFLRLIFYVKYRSRILDYGKNKISTQVLKNSNAIG